MYIAGLPGTGKTLCVNEILDNGYTPGHRPEQVYAVLKYNCMNAFGTYSLYVELVDQLYEGSRVAPKK